MFSYQLLSNVGCEIIIRGTIAFLTKAFPNYDLDFVVSSYHVERDRSILADLANVRIVPMIAWKRYARGVLVKTGLDRRYWTPRFSTRHFLEADLFVSVGGDIYTMSGNGLPRDWLGYEQFATRNGIPSLMFGANMEKFEVLNARDLSWLLDHLQRFRLIAVRDKATVEYLAQHGISSNTVNFPDPIFMLRPRCTFGVGPIRTIGLNASPLLLRDFGDGVFNRLAEIVIGLAERNYRVNFIPHVYASDNDPRLDDRVALRCLHDLLPAKIQANVSLYDGPISLADITREINQVDLFVGARMHSCLNAVTLGKPTYFLSYSRKARTMVDWLCDGPLAAVRERIESGSASEVQLEAILALVRAHEDGAPNGPITIDFDALLETSTIWNLVSHLDLLGKR